MKEKIKIVVILGQTATGKSDIAVKLAKDFGGEVISADSRQVYRGLSIGSGKITKSEMKSVPHHLLDVANPKRKFSVAQYKKLADEKIEEIYNKNVKSVRSSTSNTFIPIVVGGSGFYIQAIVDGLVLPEVNPDYKLRRKLEKKSPKALFEMLKKLDKDRAKEIEKEIANLKENNKELEVKWKNEKQYIDAIKSSTAEIDDLKNQADL